MQYPRSASQYPLLAVSSPRSILSSQYPPPAVPFPLCMHHPRSWLPAVWSKILRGFWYALVMVFAYQPFVAHALGPNTSALSSLLFPGLGQLINEDYASGGWQMGAYWALNSRILSLKKRPDYLEDTLIKSSNEKRINHTTLEAETLSVLQFNGLAFYSGYDAYRSARALPEYRLKYSRTPIPKDTLLDLSLAPFRWRNFTDLTVLVPLALAANAALGDPIENTEDPSKNDFVYRREGGLSRDTLRAHHFVSFQVVGMGEEAFFRGYLNTEFVERFGPVWGVAMSSLTFGSLHSGSGGSANQVLASLFGVYTGWMHLRNDYSLQQVVALHSWWDVLISYRASKDRKSLQIPIFTVANKF